MTPILQNSGYCPICEAQSNFVSNDAWLRDHYRCERCSSIPRERALISVLNERIPRWRELRIHESSPCSALSAKLKKECAGYVATHFFSDVPTGHMHAGFRCENLEAQTFQDESFDIVITQDVMEHVLDPLAAFREIRRTLQPRGFHIFTTPMYPMEQSRVRARSVGGVVEYVEDPVYHGNPIEPKGALVTIDYGFDLPDLVFNAARMTTTVYKYVDKERGILGEFLEVCVSRKAASSLY